jgi:hypothetical protein
VTTRTTEQDIRRFVDEHNRDALNYDKALYLYEASGPKAGRRPEAPRYTVRLPMPVGAEILLRIVSDGRLWKIVAADEETREHCHIWYPQAPEKERTN